MAIGMPIMQEIERDFHTDSEVYDFRKSAIGTVKNAIQERDRKGIDGAALYAYPADVCDRANLPPNIYGHDRGRLSTQLLRSNSPMQSNSNLSISRSSCSLKSMLTSKESQGSATATQGGGSGGSSGGSETGGGGGGGGGNSGGAGNSGAADLESASLVSSLFRTSVDQSDAVSTGSFDDASLNVENLSLCESVSDYRCYVEDQPMCVWILQNGVEASKFTVRVSISGFPLDVIRAVIRKRMRYMTLPVERHEQVVEKYQYQYITSTYRSDACILSYRLN